MDKDEAITIILSDQATELAINKISDMIKEAAYNKFYGSFEIKFENGKVVNCKKTESIKI